MPIQVQGGRANQIMIQLGGGQVARDRAVTSVKNGIRTVFTERNGNKHLQATKGDEVLFEGPVNTLEQLRGVPANIRADLEARGLVEKGAEVP